jgi:hypothetical protein
MPPPWSYIEVELIVADYFAMLEKELAGIDYSKADHRRKIQQLLDGRSGGSIEYKHQNISAVLAKFGQPFIKGYLPRYNYQLLLEEKVIDYLASNVKLEQAFESFSQMVVGAGELKINYASLLVDPPAGNEVSEPFAVYKKMPVKVNYLEREQNNRKLGMIGEKIVLEFEKRKLISIGKERLADKIEWISKEQGDGAGFDILSRYPNGKDKYIEVKSTKLSREAPFYFTRNELHFSREHAEDYHLYRLFNMNVEAKMFIKKGDLNTICHAVPITFQGYF